MLTSTPQSVDPATTQRVGAFGQQLQGLGQVRRPHELGGRRR